MYAAVELGVKVGSRLLPVPLSWTTASRHCLGVHYRYEHETANHDQQLQNVAAGCAEHSSDTPVTEVPKHCTAEYTGCKGGAVSCQKWMRWSELKFFFLRDEGLR
jgi:hypothetical protein